MAKVFVSYSRKDIEFAKRLTAELQKSEFDFWIDWEGIPPTVDWWREIEKGIEESDVFIFLISPDSAKSKICGKEIDTAVKNAKRIIPLVTRDIKGDEAPTQLSHLNWIFVRESDDFDAAVKKLMTAIQTDYEWAATHRRLQVKALDWERNSKENGFLLRGMDLLDAEQDLATNTSKDPHPTDLQREYVFTSRTAADRQRRITMGFSIAGIIALAALAIWGWGQAVSAKIAQATAEANEATAQAASTLAFENAIRADHEAATAQAASTLAVFNEKEAEKQAQIALARQWVAEANAVLASPNGNAEIAALLSVRALQVQKDEYVLSADAALVASFNRIFTIKVFDQHASKASAVAYSPKGDRVAIGYVDGTAGLYDVNTGKEISHFDGFAGYDLDNNPEYAGVHAVSFSSTGDHLLVAGSDGHILVWNLATDSKENEYIFQDQLQAELPLWSAKFSPDNKYILFATGEPYSGFGNVYLIERETGRSFTPLPAIENLQTRFINDVEFSKDGKMILSTSYDGTAILWDMNWATLTASQRKTFTSSIPLRDGAISADGKFVLLGENNNTAELYTIDGKLQVRFIGHTDNVFSVNFSPIEGYVLTGSADGTARLWDIQTGKTIRTFVGDTDQIRSTAFSPDGKFVITGSWDNTARIWSADPMHDAQTIHGHLDRINSVSFSPDGNAILSASRDNRVRLWNAKTLEFENLIQLSDSLLNPNAVFSSNGKWIAASSDVSQEANPNLVFWEHNGSAYINPIPINTLQIASLAFSPSPNAAGESEYLMIGYQTGEIDLRQNANGIWRVIKKFWGPGYPTSMAFTRDSNYIVSTNHTNGSVPIFSIQNPDTAVANCVAQLSSDKTKGSWAIAFSNDMKYLAANLDGDIMIMDWQTNPNGSTPHECIQVKKLQGHSAEIRSLTFSPNGNYLLSTSLDGTAILWDIRTWKSIRTLIGHEGEVTSAGFSPDGTSIVTGGADKTIRIWDTDYKDTVRQLCSILLNLGRDFTPGERTKYGISDQGPTCIK